MFPKFYLDAGLWHRLPVDFFFSRYAGDEEVYPQELTPDSVYRSISLVPTEVFVRTSEREKRLEFELEAKKVAEGKWGTLFEVSGAGSQVGLVTILNPIFIGAHVLPDMVHLMGNSESVAFDGIIRDIYLAKATRMFEVGYSLRSEQGEDVPFDVVMTSKNRWFRIRNNPKYLGFSKEEK